MVFWAARLMGGAYVVKIYQPHECSPQELCLPPKMPHLWVVDREGDQGLLLVLPAGLREVPEGMARDELPGLGGLYQRLLRRSRQLAQCQRYDAPSLILEHERQELLRAVTRLFGAPRRRPGRGPTLYDHLQRACSFGDETGLVAEVPAIVAALGLAIAQ